MPAKRPVIRDLERSGADISLEALSLIGLLVLLALTLYFYPRLPAVIPRHFNFRGEADGWGGKQVLFIMPVIAVILYAGLTVLEFFPHVFNYPWPITESNARRQYSIARQMLAAVKLSMVVSFLYVTWAMIQAAGGNQNGLSLGFIILETPILLGIMGYSIFKAKQAQ